MYNVFFHVLQLFTRREGQNREYFVVNFVNII